MKILMKKFWTRENIMLVVVIVIFVIVITSGITLVVRKKIRSGQTKFLRSAWGYKCETNRCVKTEITKENEDTTISHAVCRIFCGDVPDTLWPIPTGEIKLGSHIMHIDFNKINFVTKNIQNKNNIWTENEERFLSQLTAKVPKQATLAEGGAKLTVTVDAVTDDMTFDLSTNESYSLVIKAEKDRISAVITAENYYGARYGLETLSQIIVYDEIRNELQAVADITITDKPVYKYRGVVLDTSRNFFSVESIKRTIEAMALTKLNTFHWHITDSHSFPLEIKSHPDLMELGAYSRYKVYTAKDVADIVHFARVRGVRVLPEFDQPAHVGEGWQKTNMTACFNYQPWSSFCVEPPCGQLDPSKDALYDVLEDIYREIYEMFEKPDLFHLGGDEVSFNCWNTSTEIKSWMTDKGWDLSEASFMKLWNHFQQNALMRFDKVSGNKKIPIILWTSHLTEEPYVSKYLSPDRYTIQIWLLGNDTKIKTLLELGYDLILSNYDALYLDCGFGGWVTDGNNWCSPFIGWQKVYENRPADIAGSYLSQIKGAEAALWSEQADEHVLDSRLWPRSSALGERLWSDPKTTWREAESRMLMHRVRLVENGITADRLEPEWCLQNDNQCPIDASIPPTTF